MSYSINKTEARVIARADLTIFNETQALMKQVITDAGNGLYETTITDGTTMTESTPTIVSYGGGLEPPPLRFSVPCHPFGTIRNHSEFRTLTQRCRAI